MQPAFGQWTPLAPVTSVSQESDGIRAVFQSGAVLKLQVCTSSVIHLLYAPTGNFPKQTDHVVTKISWTPVPWKMESSDKNVTLSTSALKVIIEKDTGAISFATLAGQSLFRDGKRLMFPQVINGEKTYRAETVVEMYGSREGFYGLGQHQAGMWNYHGESMDVSQENTNIAVPVLMSSRGFKADAHHQRAQGFVPRNA